MRIVILGATGALGKATVKQALDAGHDVVAYVRRPDAVPARSGVTIVQGSLDNVAAMTKAFTGADAVISCVGAKLTLASMQRMDLMQRVLPLVTSSVKTAGVDRFVLVSAFGVGDTAAKASGLARFLYRTIVSAIFKDKARAEVILPRSGLNWTTVYPVILHEARRLDAVTVTPIDAVDKVPGLPKVPFSNVAAVLIELAADRSRSGQRLLITI